MLYSIFAELIKNTHNFIKNSDFNILDNSDEIFFNYLILTKLPYLLTF